VGLIVVVVDGVLGRQANEVTPGCKMQATARWPRRLVVIATSVELYKTLHDARRKLRSHLDECGLRTALDGEGAR
jgi:hypothetical protein